jgi:transposase-like protein
MRNQKCESKNLLKLLKNNSKKMYGKKQKHQRQLEENGETKRSLIKEFRQMKHTTEKWESWQQETDNKVDSLEEGAREKNIAIFGIAEGENESNYYINWFRVLRRFLARLI